MYREAEHHLAQGAATGFAVADHLYQSELGTKLWYTNQSQVDHLFLFIEFYKRYADFEKMEASLVCLEGEVELRALHPNSCQTVNLHFIAIKGHLHTIEKIDLIDLDSQKLFHIPSILQIFVKT